MSFGINSLCFFIRVVIFRVSVKEFSYGQSCHLEQKEKVEDLVALFLFSLYLHLVFVFPYCLVRTGSGIHQTCKLRLLELHWDYRLIFPRWVLGDLSEFILEFSGLVTIVSNMWLIVPFRVLTLCDQCISVLSSKSKEWFLMSHPWSLWIHISPVYAFQTAGSLSLWAVASPGPTPQVAATLGICLDTHSDLYCCCNCHTLSARSYMLAAAAVHCLCSLLRGVTQQQPASGFTAISSRFGETIGNS